MAKIRNTLVMAAMAATLAVAAQAQDPGGSSARGEALVDRHCGRCHATGLTGKSPEPAAPPFRELHRRYDPDELAEALAEGLLTGHPMMPEFRFSPNDVRAIIDYLKSIQTRDHG